MNAAGDFQIINALNPKSKSDLYLVKNTSTEKLFVWRTFLLKNLPRDKKDNLCRKIRKRIQQEHVLLVKFYPAIEEEKLKLVYVPMDYYPHGNLADFVRVLATSETTHICEEIIVKILFQLSVLVKSVEFNDYLKMENLYFDGEFNVKFLNFAHSGTQTKYDVKMCDVGIILMQLCTLTTETLSNKYTVNKEYYSDELIDLIEVMLKDNKPVTSKIDKVIQHPVVLLNTFKLNCGIKLSGCFEILDYRSKLEQLRKRESMLNLKENKIAKKEQGLNVREKKLHLHERTVKDKLTQANIYLNRCRQNKFSQLNKYENIDTSLTVEYEEIEESDIVETSKKLDISKIKLQPIGRSLSERKVQFKGHSPLKKVNFNRTKSHKKHKEKLLRNSDNSTESTNIKTNLFKDISNVDKTQNNVKYENTKKAVLSEHNIDTVPDANIIDTAYRPIAWTEQNKKQAFEMLRIMNSTSDKQFWDGEVMHTFL